MRVLALAFASLFFMSCSSYKMNHYEYDYIDIEYVEELQLALLESKKCTSLSP